MIQLSYIRENKQDVINRLAIKNIDAAAAIEEIIALDQEKRKAQTEVEMLLSEQNTLAKQIGELFKSGKKAEADDLRNRSASIKELAKGQEEKLAKLEDDLKNALVVLPNIPSPSVPSGKTPEDNAVVFEHGQKPQLAPGFIPHWELTTKYNLIEILI